MFRSALILLGLIALGCRGRDDLPTPPAPPDLTKREVSKPPGSDDYAHRSFAFPLSVQNAEAILRHTQVFAFGGMLPNRQVQAFNVSFEQPDAVSRFQHLAEIASPAGNTPASALRCSPESHGMLTPM